jgi:SAM-dependent methyltransferase
VAFHDHFSGHAREYTRYRPRYPRELFAFLASLPPRREHAWDCGTGNGQAAGELAEFFAQVTATDPSANQIANARPHDGVQYLVALAERCPLPAASVDLVTVAQALHWFDLERFHAEVRRVVRPGGVLGAWSYGLAKVSPEVDTVIATLYSDVLGPYWPPERAVVEQEYATITFPFEEIDAPRFTMTACWNLDDLVGYLNTWSSAQAFVRQHGTDPLDPLRSKLEEAWGSAQSTHDVTWPLYLRVCRVA